MIETRKEAQHALKDIIVMTGWSLREVARRCQLNAATLCRLLNNPDGATPYETTRREIYKLHTKVSKRRNRRHEQG